MIRSVVVTVVVAAGILSACSSSDDETPGGGTSSSSSSSSTSSSSSSSGGTTSSSSSGNAPDGGSPTDDAGAGPTVPATFREGIVVFYDGTEKVYKADGKATFMLNPTDGQNQYELRAGLNTVGYSDMVLTMIADTTKLTPGFTVGQVDRVAILLEHSQVNLRFLVGPASQGLTLVDTKNRLRGVAEGKTASYTGPEKQGPFVRVEFDVEIPANAK